VRSPVVVSILVIGGVAGAWIFHGSRGPADAPRAASGASDASVSGLDGDEASTDPDAGNGTQDRLAALEAAERGGTFGVNASVPRATTPGWSGERAVSARSDDWEPAIAADPNAPWVYRLVTRHGGPKACGKCPDPAIILQVSRNGGATWDHRQYPCRCRASDGTFDPQIEVVPSNGHVYAASMPG
jgi:hypothetical protein